MPQHFEITKIESGETFDKRSFRKVEGKVYQPKVIGRFVKKVYLPNILTTSMAYSFIIWDEFDNELLDLEIGDVIEGDLINTEDIIHHL